MCGIVTINEMRCGFMPEKILKTDVVIILKSLQEVFHAKGRRLYVPCGLGEGF